MAVATPIITKDQAKTFLNIDVTDYDAELTDFVATASQMIANRIGHVAGSVSLDEWYDGGTERIALRNEGPIQSVTSVTESFGSIVYTLSQVTLDTGSVADAYSYTVDLDRGLLTRRAAGIAIPFAFGVRNIHVVYVAGFGTTPPDITHACQLLVKHLWETQRGTSRPGADMAGATAYTFPNRVEEILAPYCGPGIA